MTYPKPYRPGGRRTYYFRYADALAKRHTQSTGCERAAAAHDFVRAFVDARRSRSGGLSFADYARPYFVWPTCPHVVRRLDAGKSIGRLHVEMCRQRVDRWVLTDAVFAGIRLQHMTRGDVLDYRSRLRERIARDSLRARGEGLTTVNRVLSAVAVVLREACFRGDIPTNPAQGIGDVSYERASPDVFALDELRTLFAEPWADPLAYSVFKVAAGTGMRASEILALPVDAVDGRLLTVGVAWKHRVDTTPGLPKWGKTREIVLADYVRLELVARIGERTEGLVYAWADGSRLGETWWRKAFARGLEERKIVIGGRRLVPHSLRHSLNTHLLQAGVDPLRIQLYLWGARRATAGAQAVTSVQHVYTHFESTMTEPVAEAIEGMLGPVAAARQEGAAG